MKYWQSLSFTEPEDLLPIARKAEEVGFEGAFMSDHVWHPSQIASAYPYSPDGKPSFDENVEWPDPWVTIGALAAVTSRLRFSTATYILPLRHVLEVAKTVATAAQISGGRVALGIGVGWMREEFEALGRDFGTRGKRTNEMMAALRAIWRGGEVEFHGEHVVVPRGQMKPVPAKPIPIFVGGQSPAALRRAGALGDGWLGAGCAPDEVAGFLASIEKARKEAGREGEPFEAIVPLTVPVDRDLARRMEDLGVSALVSYPLAFQIGPGRPLAEKLAALERYGNDVIAATA
jgi:probable F420-dependent oxidoreductase